MLGALVFEVATRLFGLVGLTFMKLSAWLPVVALTFTTGSKQASGTISRSVVLSGRSLGIMHFRGPSSILTLSVAAVIWACKMDVVGVMSASRTASRVRLQTSRALTLQKLRRLFICVFLWMWRVRV